ncbi:Leucine zipper protein 2 [Lemmus lemmus]
MEMCRHSPEVLSESNRCPVALLRRMKLCLQMDYEELEKQLKEVFKERSTVLRQLTKKSRELDGIKVNPQSLKNDEQSSKTDVQKLLELDQKQREEMKSLQEALKNQLKETSEKAEKHRATNLCMNELGFIEASDMATKLISVWNCQCVNISSNLT